MSPSKEPSATSRVFLVLLISVVVVSVGVTATLIWDNRRTSYGEAERSSYAFATVLADSEGVRDALAEGPEARRNGRLQRLIQGTREDIGAGDIDVIDLAGIGYTSTDPELIGLPYAGSVPSEETALTEEWVGAEGRSVRTVMPVYGAPYAQLADAADGDLIGWVSVSFKIEPIMDDLPLVLSIAACFAALGVGGALLGRRVTRRVTGDLSTDAVRDAVSSYDSLRTLGEAMRAQTHEHGNRLHTAVALLELGDVDTAIEMLTETSQRSQILVDLVTSPKTLDPTASALILGKTSQATERGVLLETEIEEAVPRAALSPMDLVSVLGNLIDNALDAAATGADPQRLVRLTMRRVDGGRLGIEVSDSGDGIPAADRDRVFEWGYSTKEAGGGIRGVGLALVRRIVRTHGGSLEVRRDPTRFIVTLPAEEER